MIINEIGNMYSRLTVLKRNGSTAQRSAKWLCRCECGTLKTILGTNLRSGRTQSCGCLNKELAAERCKARALPQYEASFNALLGSLKYKAEYRRIEWTLNKECVRQLTKQPCFYCGIEPYQIHYDYIYNGLDRVDSTKGYTPSNVVPCCGRCNMAKNDMSLMEFDVWLTRLYEFRIGGDHEC